MSNIIREYLNTDDIIEIHSLDSNTRKDNLAQKLANLPRVEVSYNLGQTESPSTKGIGTHRNLSTDVKSNCNLNEQYQTVKIENVGGGCFDKDNLPEITSLDELLNALCEVMIRFDTAPSNYLKDDYTFVIKTLSNALIHLYMNGGDFNYERLSNLPSINDILIKGNVSLDELLLYSQDEVDEIINGQVEEIGEQLSNKADKETTLGGYGITDAYTKTEIDNKISAVFRYKGSVPTYIDLIALTGMTVGDVYNVTETGNNYAWNGTEWDKLSGEIDLSAYLTIVDASNTYETIENVDLLEGVVSGHTTNISNLQSDKADKATTLSGYGITNAYTKTEVDIKFDNTRTYKIENVLVSTWSASTSYSKYAYEASIPIENLKESDLVEVIYSIPDAESTNYAPGGELYEGYIKIFAKVNMEITIPALVITKIDL